MHTAIDSTGRVYIVCPQTKPAQPLDPRLNPNNWIDINEPADVPSSSLTFTPQGLRISGRGAASEKTSPQKRGFVSCTLTGKVGATYAATALDAVGVIPGGGNLLHGIQLGAGIVGAGFAVAGDATSAGLSAGGVGLALADRTGASTVVHGFEIIPIIGNVISIGATIHDVTGGEGMVASYKGCMAGTH